MSSGRTWQILGKVANAIGILWVLAALGVLGYFANLAIEVLRHGG